MQAHRFLHVIMAVVFAFSLIGAPAARVAADEPQVIVAWFGENRVEGYGWPLGEELTLTIDPEMDPPPFDAGTAVVGADPDHPGEKYVNFAVDPEFYRLHDNDEVTIHGVSGSKTTKVIWLTEAEFNIQQHTLAGQSYANQVIQVSICPTASCAQQTVTADDSGGWSGTWQISGIDLLPGTWVKMSTGDDVNGYTKRNWQYPEGRIKARANWDWIIAKGWRLGDTLRLTLHHNEAGLGPDYTTSEIVTDLADDGNTSKIEFKVGEHFDIVPGDTATITDLDLGVTKNMTVGRLAVTSVDLANNIIYGVAEPGERVSIALYREWLDDYPATPGVTADPVTGEWSIDLGADSTGASDLGLSSAIETQVMEQDGNGTWFMFSVPGIMMGADRDQLGGYAWPLDSTVDLTIHRPETSNSEDYHREILVPNTLADMQGAMLQAVLAGAWDLKAGDELTLDGHLANGQPFPWYPALTAKVQPLTVNVDVATNTISGTTIHDAPVIVNEQRVATADADGAFSVHMADIEQQLRFGSSGFLGIFGPDYGQTNFRWEVPVPACQAGTSVSGTVWAAEDDRPLAGAQVDVEEFDTGYSYCRGYADENGAFAFQLEPGSYRVRAYSGYYGTEYYDNTDDAGAARLDITAASHVTGVNFTLSIGLLMEHYEFNLDHPLLQDYDVRKAIALGVDRQRILDEAFLPNGEYGTVLHTIVPTEHWASAPVSQLTVYPYDPATAQKILTDAGWEDRDADGYRENEAGAELAFTFRTSDLPQRVAAGQLFKQEMQDIGIRASVYYGNLGDFLGSGDWDIVEFAWWQAYPDDQSVLSEGYTTGNANNFTGYSSAALDAAVADATVATTNAAKLVHYIDQQAILSQDLPILPMFTRYSVPTAVTAEGSDVTVAPTSDITINFNSVEQGGVTAAALTGFGEADLPGNFGVLGRVYDIGTSATFTSAQVCLDYDDAGLTLEQEQTIKLMHLEGETWLDVTDPGYPNTEANVVCGTVTSFSPFALTAPNHAPSDVSLSSTAIKELKPAGTVVGTLSSADADGDTTFTYKLVDTPLCPGPDNASFHLAGDKLISSAVFDYETKNSYSICVQTKDWVSTFEKPLIITVTDLSEFTKSIRSTGTQDGWILETSETSKLGGLINTADATFRLGDDAARKQYRAILSFGTGSLLPDGAQILSAKLVLRKQGVTPAGSNPFSIFQGLMIDVRKGFFGTSNTLQASDFQVAPARITVGPYKPVPVGSLYTINLPSNALPSINKLATGGGLTQLRLAFKLDDNNNNVANYINFYSGNVLTTSYRPQLVVTYFMP